MGEWSFGCDRQLCLARGTEPWPGWVEVRSGDLFSERELGYVENVLIGCTLMWGNSNDNKQGARKESFTFPTT